jgi:catechol 2,3-dioxygenase
MNQNIAAQPRAAVHSIDHFALNVPSVLAAECFFTAFGLRVMRINDEVELRAGDDYRWARVLPASRKSLAYLSFNCFDGELPAIEFQAREAGASFDVESKLKNDRGIWFYDVDNNLVQVQVGPKTTPITKVPLLHKSVPADARGSCMRSQAQTVHPRRLSHVLLFSPDVLRAIDFYHRAIGLNLSDKSIDIIAFMHGAHGSDHHLVAFAKSSAKGWHHCAWDVASIDEVGQGAAQMVQAGFSKGWGTGRHVLGSNYFHYVQDPWGSFAEYSADIDFVTAGTAWPAGDFAPEDSLYLWGPDVPEYFIHNTEAESDTAQGEST